MVTAEREDHAITRDVERFKKINEKLLIENSQNTYEISSNVVLLGPPCLPLINRAPQLDRATPQTSNRRLDSEPMVDAESSMMQIDESIHAINMEDPGYNRRRLSRPTKEEQRLMRRAKERRRELKRLRRCGIRN